MLTLGGFGDEFLDNGYGFYCGISYLRRIMDVLNDPIVTEKTVFARNCEVRKIDRTAADAFLDANHIYGSASCRHCYGLFRRRVTGAAELRSLPGSAGVSGCSPDGTDGAASGAMQMGNAVLTEAVAGELVAVAAFSNARRWEKQGRTVSSYEWVRYASLRDTRVIGGMGKLLKAFIADRHPDDVMTYAISTAVPGRPIREGTDSEGNVFRKLGFTEESRCTFPSRIKGEEGQLSVSIKFRLKLAGWE